MTKSKIDKLVIANDVDDYLDYLYLELGDVRKQYINNPFLLKDWNNPTKVPELLVEHMTKPENLHFLCKYVFNIDLLPYQCVILQTLWTHPLVCFLASRGAAKSFLLSVYLMLRMLLQPGIKVSVVGAALRQSMVLWNYCNSIWDNAPILRDIVGFDNKPKRDIHFAFLKWGDSHSGFLPIGTGEKIRGQRAGIVIAEEFASVNPTVFETVIRGFAAVKSTGLFNSVKEAYRKDAIKQMEELQSIVDELIAEDPLTESSFMTDNQIIMSGTSYYKFNHFYKYYSLYKAIITSGGDIKKIQHDFPDMTLPENIDSRKYAIIRLPYDMLPKGMMDETILTQGQATMDPAIFGIEFNVLFPSDSVGFFQASTIDTCTVKNVPLETNFGSIYFGAKLQGSAGRVYVMGIDPASEEDNFAINIVEAYDEYGLVVYQWTTNRKKFEKDKADGFISEGIEDYNTFIISHIRHLLRRFNIQLIVMDSGGGGLSVREGLRDPTKMIEGDKPIVDMDEDNPAPKDPNALSILKMIAFSSYAWRQEAHHGLRHDLLDRRILFPYYDMSEVEVQNIKDKKAGNVLDTLEDCYLEIEQCKVEMTYIKHEQTPTGQEKWDVPKVVGIDADNQKKRLKKDRFSSLLLANWGRRFYTQYNSIGEYQCFGGVSKSVMNNGVAGQPYYGPGIKTFKNFSGTTSHHYAATKTNNGRRIFY